MARSFAQAATFEPLSAINTTPMIDVMLVLIIMMIMSLPAPTHKVPVDLPGDAADIGTPPPVHRLTITEGGNYLWDSAPLATAGLALQLAAFRADPARPVLHVETSQAATYDAFDRTMAMVKRAGISRIGFVGNAPGF